MFTDKGIKWLYNLFNNILKTKKMSYEWTISISVPIYNNNLKLYKLQWNQLIESQNEIIERVMER